MEQLTQMDNNFLQQESVRTPMHISPVIVYDPSTRPGGKVRYKDMLTVFERNLHKSASFRRRLAANETEAADGGPVRVPVYAGV